MKTLLDIKNNYAQEQGYADWESLRWGKMSQIEETESDIDEICIRAQKAALEKAADSGEVYVINLINGSTFKGKSVVSMPSERMKFSVDRTSITNPENLIR